MEELLTKAEEMLRYSYAPYSRFKVGAALMSKDGRIFTGCNIENVAYGSTICAEQAAFSKAISEGVTRFKAIAVASSKGSACPPCGACRQVMAEFCEEDFMIILNGKTFTLKELLPESFDNEQLS